MFSRVQNCLAIYNSFIDYLVEANKMTTLVGFAVYDGYYFLSVVIFPTRNQYPQRTKVILTVRRRDKNWLVVPKYSCNEQLITIVHCAIRPTLTPRLNVTCYMKT